MKKTMNRTMSDSRVGENTIHESENLRRNNNIYNNTNYSKNINGNFRKQKSEKAGLTKSEFLRSCIKGYKIKEQPNEIIKQFQRDLSGIANNINQIAHQANLYEYISQNNLNYIKKSLTDFILKFEKEIYSRQR